MQEYTTILDRAEDEFVERKSRFIGAIAPVETEEEALEYCAAFIQLYREQAHYLERTAPWIERVGLDHVKSQMLDQPEAIRKLAARFRISQKYSQDDPWAQRASGDRKDLHQHLAEFRPLVVENA